MSLAQQLMKAPIQGENLTKNTLQYSWHRPPQFPKYDDAFRHYIDSVIANEEVLSGGFSLVMSGMPATTAISSLLVKMVGDGKISPDMSLLLAGPAYKVFTRMLDYADIEYLTGFESTKETTEFFKKIKTTTPPTPSDEDQRPLPKDVIEESQDVAEKVNMPTGGLMGAVPEDAEEPQMSMDLGAPEPTNLIEEEMTDEPS